MIRRNVMEGSTSRQENFFNNIVQRRVGRIAVVPSVNAGYDDEESTKVK